MLWQLFLLDAVLMTGCWLWATYNHRAGIVDVAWSFCIALNILLTAWLVDDALMNVRLFIGIFSSIWFIRCKSAFYSHRSILISISFHIYL